MEELLTKLLFGKYLRLRVSALIEKNEVLVNRALGEARFTQTHARLLEAASLENRQQELTLLLGALADDPQICVPDFLGVVQSQVWSDFINAPANRILAAVDEHANHYRGDGFVLDGIHERGIPAGFDAIAPSETREMFLNRIRSFNCLVLGTAKRNRAAEWFLRAFWNERPPVTFEYPDRVEASLLSVRHSQTASPRLVLTEDGREIEEKGKARVGILAVVKNATRPGRTAIMAAGCSRHSTKDIMREMFTSPTPYVLLDSALERDPSAPVVLVFNSLSKPRWTILGRSISRLGRPRTKPRAPAG